MKWQQGRRSSNVEDRRGMGLGRGATLGGLGLGGTLILFVIAMVLGVDPVQLLRNVEVAQVPATGAPADAPAPGGPGDEQAAFVSVVLADTEDVWGEVFAANGQRYAPPTLVLFSDRVSSACGLASAASGPFYCPADGKVYIDLVFFDELHRRFQAPGDFAQAYVIAHEIGHHVQKLLGISASVHQQQQRLSKADGNELSVRLELQADCLAGVWAHRAERSRSVLEPGDLEEALAAASAIGDDRIQRSTQGYVVPDSFTHGSSEQRSRWFQVGFTSGDVDRCDTFAAGRL
jgi:predicted metalloprotease